MPISRSLSPLVVQGTLRYSVVPAEAKGLGGPTKPLGHHFYSVPWSKIIYKTFERGDHAGVRVVFSAVTEKFETI
jgi:hypothetical protein